MVVSVVLTTVLLGVVFVAVAVWHASSSLKDLSSQLLTGSAKSTASLIESELQTRISLLEALIGPDPSVPISDAALERINRILMAQGSQVFRVTKDDPTDRLPPMPRMPKMPGNTYAQIAISDLYFDPRTGQPRIAITFPAFVKEGESGLLALSIAPETLLEGASWRSSEMGSLLFAVTDSKGRIIARSRNPGRYVGKMAPDWAKVVEARSDAGSFTAKTAEGAPIIFAFRKLKQTPGWVVVVGEPLDEFDARWMMPAYSVITANLLALFMGLLLAIWMVRLILNPIKALAAHGERVAAGEHDGSPPLPINSPVREFNTLQRSLLDAEDTLRRRASALTEALDVLAVSEQRYRALASAGTLAWFQADGKGNMTVMTGWRELTGMQEDEALEEWHRSVHPDDWPELQAARQYAIAHLTVMNVEFRIRSKDGRWCWVRSRSAPVLTADGELVEWVGLLEDVDERRQAQEKIRHLAHHDSLTGLCNRTYLQEQLPRLIEDARQRSANLAVYLIDIDKFKEVNDSGGHGAGDTLLISIARSLRRNAHAGLVARLGGDEFVVVKPDVGDDASAVAFGNQLQADFRRIPSSSTISGFATASIGYAIFPRDGTDVDHLLRHADMALYQSKNSRAGTTCGFTSAMADDLQHRLELEKDLFQAVTNRPEEIHVFYQPQFRSSDRKLVGYEALARWTHPRYGPIPPQTFVTIAEEIGIINALGELILRQACRDAIRWPDDVSLAVNLSAIEVSQIDLPSIINGILLSTGLRAHRLELEVTEGVLIRDRELALGVLRRLKAMGIKIAMDDFGTGYSSLEYLHVFPFDKVKIDRSFITEITDSPHANAIVRSIVSLGEVLHFQVIAEGVESERQISILNDIGCEYVQGFLLGHPVSIDATISAKYEDA
ncbi:hypothetical protein NT2_04_02190 [Caenibius tardaugens NBRC 16725]|uniref:Signaling protein n=1 Tax=Caenibius tardaugens NBRC 16725 TaxID=1219035 RepID=U2YKK8_9SPHN|nr:EAL domain-containing protein [Caenibius tardaugens]GAD48807.1 hypothetical protein NT2_04_02190 [Caenibius tardaugens NBRC 16725]